MKYEGMGKGVHRIVVGIGVVVTALMLHACGSAEPSTTAGTTAGTSRNTARTPQEMLRLIAQRVETAGSYVVVADLVVERGRERRRVTGRVVYQDGPPRAANVAVKTENWPGLSGDRVIMIGDTVYVHSSSLQGPVKSRKPWIRAGILDLDTCANTQPIEVEGWAKQFDLVTTVRAISRSKDARAVGGDRVDGVATTRYTGTFAFDRDTDGLEETKVDLSGMEMTFDLWADVDQIIRKIVATAVADGVTVTYTVRVTDVGTARVAAPPADQVGELAEGETLYGPRESSVSTMRVRPAGWNANGRAGMGCGAPGRRSFSGSP
ncbi:hypothetical protein AB0K60_17070 [Thermopolyspora sp. NPDC052614]|uniref:hypothetical protein n=1 Tax=Thermopolyspora sp. NPDC052614 TaxID=3155682 RepID=UPI0034153CC7